MGRIGRAFAKRAAGFGMTVCYHNRKPLDAETERRYHAHFIDSVDELVQTCDILSLHVPLSPDTKHLIDKERIAMMTPDTIIINTARGPIIEEEALASALHDGRLGGAGLDVFEKEPEVHPLLLSAPNCVLLPHIGSATHKTRGRMSALAASSIISHLEGKPDHAIPALVFQRPRKE